MTFYLVRHAKEYSRARWIEDSGLRPLTPVGDLQSRAIATAIAAAAVTGLRLAGLPDVNLLAGFTIEVLLFVSVYLATWPVLPGGRATLLELLSLTRELRRAPKQS